MGVRFGQGRQGHPRGPQQNQQIQQNSRTKSPRCPIWAWLLLLWVGLNSIALVHMAPAVSEVTGTWHIEPDSQLVSGQPALVWVALTRNEGTVLLLEQGNCQLGVYALPRNQGDEPLLQPTLTPIAEEAYDGASGAEVIFPRSGQYELELGCVPKTVGDFEPFQLTREVTVTDSAAPAVESGSAAAQPAAVSTRWGMGTAALAVCIGIGMLIQRRLR